MKLSILEMEKYWKNKEKEIALERLRILEERFTEIEKEKQETLASLDQPDAIRSSRSIRRQEEPAEPAPSAGTFRIRY
jgi:hypothetical protein